MFKNEEITTSSLPNIGTVDFKSIHKKYLYVLLLGNLMRYVVVFCALVLAEKFLDIEPLEQYFGRVLLVLAVALLLHTLYYQF